MSAEVTARPVPDIATIAATARRMDALVAALAAECAKGEAGQGWVPCRVIRRLLGEVGA